MIEQYKALAIKIKKYNPALDEERLFAAFKYSERAHENQKRKDGTPFVSHPLAAAEIVADMQLDADAVIAALLHDCIEDTGASYDEIKGKFGAVVADLVEGVTKLTRVQFSSKEEEQMENLRKMLLAMAKDIRVILIKIADRLHNMRTMNYQTIVKQREKALETMEIYAPIAHRLGMQKMKWELEDLSLKYLDPIGYDEITKELKRSRRVHEEFLELIKTRIGERLLEAGIEANLSGRTKHIYSIYRKMYSQNKSLSEVYDLYAFRVIVGDIADCYNVLGYIHDLYKPIPGRFKDYISTPKPNMYQSLHTTVIGREGVPFEVQIRTWDMHDTAEYGIASHWRYKHSIEGRFGEKEKLEWVRRLLETQQDTDAEDFIRSLKIDMFDDEVFVFTPKGKVINLPAGATPIDFAYAIHTEIGNHMTGAKINAKIVNFDYVLQNGDIVEIISSSSAHGPSRDWLSIVKTNGARGKIRQWFKREKREENVTHGKGSFEAELKRGGISMAAITGDDILPHILKRVSFGSLEEMYAAIGYGGISAAKLVNHVRDELIRANRQKNDQTALKILSKAVKTRRPDSGIVVEGVDNCLVKFSRCCTPVPGDAVIGFITKGYGVSVHRADCPNVLSSMERPEEKGRWLKVSWAKETKDIYSTSLSILSRDREGLVVDIATALNSMRIRMTTFNIHSRGDGTADISVVLEVKDSSQLTVIKHKLERINGVLEVTRRTGA